MFYDFEFFVTDKHGKLLLRIKVSPRAVKPGITFDENDDMGWWRWERGVDSVYTLQGAS